MRENRNFMFDDNDYYVLNACNITGDHDVESSFSSTCAPGMESLVLR